MSPWVRRVSFVQLAAALYVAKRLRYSGLSWPDFLHWLSPQDLEFADTFLQNESDTKLAAELSNLDKKTLYTFDFSIGNIWSILIDAFETALVPLTHHELLSADFNLILGASILLETYRNIQKNASGLTHWYARFQEILGREWQTTPAPLENLEAAADEERALDGRNQHSKEERHPSLQKSKAPAHPEEALRRKGAVNRLRVLGSWGGGATDSPDAGGGGGGGGALEVSMMERPGANLSRADRSFPSSRLNAKARTVSLYQTPDYKEKNMLNPSRNSGTMSLVEIDNIDVDATLDHDGPPPGGEGAGLLSGATAIFDVTTGRNLLAKKKGKYEDEVDTYLASGRSPSTTSTSSEGEGVTTPSSLRETRSFRARYFSDTSGDDPLQEYSDSDKPVLDWTCRSIYRNTKPEPEDVPPGAASISASERSGLQCSLLHFLRAMPDPVSTGSHR